LEYNPILQNFFALVFVNVLITSTVTTVVDVHAVMIT